MWALQSSTVDSDNQGCTPAHWSLFARSKRWNPQRLRCWLWLQSPNHEEGPLQRSPVVRVALEPPVRVVNRPLLPPSVGQISQMNLCAGVFWQTVPDWREWQLTV